MDHGFRTHDWILRNAHGRDKDARVDPVPARGLRQDRVVRRGGRERTRVDSEVLEWDRGLELHDGRVAAVVRRDLDNVGNVDTRRARDNGANLVRGPDGSRGRAKRQRERDTEAVGRGDARGRQTALGLGVEINRARVSCKARKEHKGRGERGVPAELRFLLC